MAEVTCPGCLERDARSAVLERRIAELEAIIRDLLTRLGINSKNSSIPPSANPLDAPKPVVKTPTGKKPGGQPGHAAHLKRRLPPERIKDTIPFIPKQCRCCHEPLPALAGPHDPEPTWHQVAELPAVIAEITEYQGHYRTCAGCGTVTHAPIPADLKAQSIGPNLAASLGYLAGCHHVSKRGLVEIAEELFAAPLSLGTVSHLETQMSAALAAPHTEALEAVRQAKIKYVDETGWKQAGQKRWLWLAATTTVAAFVIQISRSFKSLVRLLGTEVYGFLCSDRYSVYNQWPVIRRQVCWAHLKRDFQKLVDRGGPSAPLGEAMLQIQQKVFEEWHLFRGGTFGRIALQNHLNPYAIALEELLERGRTCADKKTATFCENLLVLQLALWQFVVTEGVEPTNNHAERLLRRGVLWRKNAFGCHSAEGCRFVERILTAVQTLRLQDRPVLRYLKEALIAHRQGLAVSSLLPVG